MQAFTLNFYSRVKVDRRLISWTVPWTVQSFSWDIQCHPFPFPFPFPETVQCRRSGGPVHFSHASSLSWTVQSTVHHPFGLALHLSHASTHEWFSHASHASHPCSHERRPHIPLPPTLLAGLTPFLPRTDLACLTFLLSHPPTYASPPSSHVRRPHIPPSTYGLLPHFSPHLPPPTHTHTSRKASSHPHFAFSSRAVSPLPSRPGAWSDRPPSSPVPSGLIVHCHPQCRRVRALGPVVGQSLCHVRSSARSGLGRSSARSSFRSGHRPVRSSSGPVVGPVQSRPGPVVGPVVVQSLVKSLALYQCSVIQCPGHPVPRSSSARSSSARLPRARLPRARSSCEDRARVSGWTTGLGPVACPWTGLGPVIRTNLAQ